MCRHRERARKVALAIVALVMVAAPAAWAEATSPDPPPEHLTVVRAPGGTPQPVSVSIDADQARQLPGTGGDPSVAAQDLPGVARSAPGATGLVIWGATPAETRVLYDGVEIPALYHFGGFRSTVGAELVGQIDVVPGAYGAEYNRALGGLVRVESRPLQGDAPHLLLDANLLDSSVSFQVGPFRGLRLAAAARASYLGETYGRLAPESSTALYPIPRYADAQVEAALDVAPGATMQALFLTSFDQVRQNLGDAGLGLPAQSEDQRLSWWRAAISYEERGADDGLATTLFVGGDRTALDQQFGTVPATETSSSTVLGLRARYRVRPSPGLRLTVGLDSLLARTRLQRAGSLTLPAREGDVTVFGQPPGDDVNADAWSATVGDIGPFAAASFRYGRWTFSPGLRGDAFPVDGNRALPPVGTTPLIGYARVAWTLDPRLAIACALSPRLILTAAAGLYHQPVDPGDLSAVFGSPTLGPTRAAHATLSAWARIAELATIEATGFYRRLAGLRVHLVGHSWQRRCSPGRSAPGKRRQPRRRPALLRRELGRGTFAWLAYTLGRSERLDRSGPRDSFDFDQDTGPHRGGLRLYPAGPPGPSARVIGATRPECRERRSLEALRRSSVTESISRSSGPAEQRSAAGVFQLDARVDRARAAGRAQNVTIYLDVQNLTGRRNPEEVIYHHEGLPEAPPGYLTGVPLLALSSASGSNREETAARSSLILRRPRSLWRPCRPTLDDRPWLVTKLQLVGWKARSSRGDTGQRG